MKTGQIGRTIKEMKDLRDSNFIDEEINEQLEILQSKLDSQCNVQMVMKNMTYEEKEQIMEEVEW